MSERDFRLYLVDILDSGSAVLAFVKDLKTGTETIFIDSYRRDSETRDTELV